MHFKWPVISENNINSSCHTWGHKLLFPLFRALRAHRRTADIEGQQTSDVKNSGVRNDKDICQMQTHSILLLPSFLYNFLLFIVINAIFGERGGKNTHLRHTTLGYCKKKRLHKTSRDIRFLLCAGGRIYCHSAKWCNREVEKNCRNCFENKNKKLLSWSYHQVCLSDQMLFFYAPFKCKENAWGKLLVLIFTPFACAAGMRFLLWWSNSINKIV